MPTDGVLSLVPLLVVRDASGAIDFYARALGAREVVRYMDRQRGTVSHADLMIGEAAFSMTEEARAWNSDAPPSLGGSPVVLQLKVANVDAAFETMCAAGATVVFPIVEFCGERMARLRDPYGHLWLLVERVEELSPDEIQRRRDAWTPPRQPPKT
ncbi:MAG TPA: VOC family protein [Polyangia bacterium]|nr:VOC family protein [Polyangia bacterium]